MASKLIILAPDETQEQLDAFCEPFRAVLSIKPKDSAVKQELEKAQEASIGVIKITHELQKAFPKAETSREHHTWKTYLEWANKNFGQLSRSVGTS